MPDITELASLYAYPDSRVPWVRTNFVSSVDGAVQDTRGLSGELGGEPDHRLFKVLRSLSDVVLVGAGTARAEGYGPITGESVHASLREGRAQVPVLAVVSKRLDIPESLRVPGVMVITTESSPVPERDRLTATVNLVVAGTDEISWPAVLDSFSASGLTRVLCEGGPRLHGTLVEGDLVDEACVTFSPHLVGGESKRITEGAKAVERSMELGHAIVDEGVLLTRWVRRRESA